MADMVPKITHIFTSRLETLYMRVSQSHPQDPLLKRISQLLATTKRIIDMTARLPGQK